MSKICKKCNIEKELSEFYYHRTRKYHMNSCKSCNTKTCLEYKHRIRKLNNIEYQIRSRAGDIKRRAKAKNVPYEEKMFNTLMDIYHKQNGVCYYTGLKLDPSGFHDENPYCFVVDRKVPEKGYVKENMVLCCNCINRIKSSYSI
ncbi:MAG: hypothetical protein NTW30_05040, partial [Candidatus Aenigmarchaeota archaeon]|nr:hypothetical protein [Candidatus Aenigmarchaeota archaeon]